MSRLDTRLRLTQSQQEREMIEFGEHEDYNSLTAVVCFILIACVVSAWLWYSQLIPAMDKTIASEKAYARWAIHQKTGDR
ncbi:MAG: hypothetical protein WCL39_12990 [Armatimonadota bacterium]